MSLEQDNISIDEAFDELVNSTDTEQAAAGTSAEETTTIEDTSTDVNANNDETSSAKETDTSEVSFVDDADNSAEGDTGEADWEARAKKLEQKIKSWEGRELARKREEELRQQQMYNEMLEKANKQTPATQENKTAELSKFKQLREEFPEIAEAIEEILQAKTKDVDDKITRFVDERVGPVAAAVSSNQLNSHMERITRKHPDAVEIGQSKKFASWIDTMPSYAKAGATHVIKLGTAEEVVALLDQYKDSIRSMTKTNQNNTDKSTEKTTNEKAVSQELAAAVKAGMAVRSGKSADPNTASARKDNSIDSYWEEAVKSYGN